jgi:glucose/arabinose dehydrogenase/putative cell wall-binding protein
VARRLLASIPAVALLSVAAIPVADDGRTISADPPAIVRASGPDRIATAIAMSQQALPDAEVAVVADDDTFADALAAAPLAAAHAAPVLLNPTRGLDGRVGDELSRLGVSDVVLMGGTAAQSETVEDALRERGLGVQRVAGVDRFATAGQAGSEAARVWRARGRAAGDRVLVALGQHAEPARAWPDALAAGALSGHARLPILLVRPTGVPAATREAIRDLGTTRATVVGGTAAIPDRVADQLGVPYDRIGGATRYRTAARLADAALAAGGSAAEVVAATGTDFADALAAGPTAVALGGVVVLIDGADLDASAGSQDWLVGRRGEVSRVTVAGGPAAVAEPVLGQLDRAVGGWRAPPLRRELVVGGLDTPLELTAPPGDDRLFIAERGGRVRVVVDGRLETFLDIRDRVRADGERGLLGLAFPPDFAASGRFFVHYNRALDGDTVLAEYRRSASDPDRAVTSDELIQLRVDQPAANHNGGTITFGPDGMLYLFLGDGGGAGDRFDNAQDPGALLGSVLRLDVSRTGTYRVPADNPFASGSGGAPEVWHYGVRNPYRASFDAVTGSLLIADVGQSQWEEVDAVSAAARGLNFGWPIMEGDHCFEGSDCDPTGLVRPVLEYSHDEGCSITGGHVYRGHIGMLRGHYVYGDFCSGMVRSFRLSDGQAIERTDWTDQLGGGSIFSFGRDASGEVYVLTGSSVFRVTE